MAKIASRLIPLLGFFLIVCIFFASSPLVRHTYGSGLRIADGVLTLAFSPDGKTLIGGGSFAKLYIWDLAKPGDEIAPEGWSIQPPTKNFFTSLAFSPDGKALGIGSDEGILLWDVSTREIIWSTKEGEGPVAFSPDGTLLASLDPAHNVRLWDAATKKCKETISWSDWAFDVAFNPDGMYLVIAYRTEMRFWNVDKKDWDFSLEDEAFISLQDFAIGAGSDSLALTNSHQIWLWNTSQNKPVGIFESQLPWTESIDTLAMSPKENILASGSWNKSIDLWNVATKERIATFIGHTSSIYALAFSPDGKFLASAGSSREPVRLWDISKRKCIAKLDVPKPEDGIVIGKDFKFVDTLDADYAILYYAYNPDTKKSGLKKLNLNTMEETFFPISNDIIWGRFCLSNDKRYAYLPGPELLKLDLMTGKSEQLTDFTPESSDSQYPPSNLGVLPVITTDKEGKIFFIRNERIIHEDKSPSYQSIYSIDSDGKNLRLITYYEDLLFDKLAYFQNGGHFIYQTGSDSHNIERINLETGEKKSVIKGPFLPGVNSLSASADGSVVVFRITNEAVWNVYNVLTGKHIEIRNHMYNAFISNSGEKIAFIDNSNAVYLADADGGNLQYMLENRTQERGDWANDFAKVWWSPDDRYLAGKVFGYYLPDLEYSDVKYFIADLEKKQILLLDEKLYYVVWIPND